MLSALKSTDKYMPLKVTRIFFFLFFHYTFNKHINYKGKNVKTVYICRIFTWLSNSSDFLLRVSYREKRNNFYTVSIQTKMSKFLELHISPCDLKELSMRIFGNVFFFFLIFYNNEFRSFKFVKPWSDLVNMISWLQASS